MKHRATKTFIGALIAVLAAAGLGSVPANAAGPLAAPGAGVAVFGDGRIVNADGDTAGKCLDIRDSGRSNLVQMWRCGSPVPTHQRWKISAFSGGLNWAVIYSYDADAANECLEDVGGGAQGVQVQMRPCTWRLGPQVWEYRHHSGDWYWWCNIDTGRCLDVRDYGTSSIVQTWPFLDQGNQRWKFA